MNARYWLGDTVPGTRSCHHFEPSSTTLIKEKQLSEHVYTIKDHYFSALPTASEIVLTLKPNDYATCICGGFWWLVLVDSINVEEKDVAWCGMQVNASSWSNKQYSLTLYWWYGHVPFNKFIMAVETPQYSILVDNVSLNSMNLSIQIVLLKIWKSEIVFHYSYKDTYNLLNNNKRNTNLTHFQVILTFFH